MPQTQMPTFNRSATTHAEEVAILREAEAKWIRDHDRNLIEDLALIAEDFLRKGMPDKIPSEMRALKAREE